MTRNKDLRRMEKVARPKSLSIRKNRIRSVILNEKAAWLLKEVKSIRHGFDFSRYISEHVVRDFELNVKGYLKYELGKLNISIEDLESKKSVLINNILDLKQQELKCQNTKGD